MGHDSEEAEAINAYIAKQRIDTSNLQVAVDRDSRTVTLSGSVADLETKVKVRLVSGNVQNVKSVNDEALMPK